MHEGQHLREYINRLNMKVTTVVSKSGIKRPTIYTHFLREKLDAETKDVYTKSIGIDWNEQPEQKLDIIKPVSPKLEAVPLRLSDPFGHESNGEMYYQLADGSWMMGVKLVPIPAQAGYLWGYPDKEWYDDLKVVWVNVDKVYHGTYLAWEVKGRSMVNITTEEWAKRSLYPGDIIITRDLKQDKWQSKLHIHTNDVWVIVHKDDGIITKEIIKHDIPNGIITVHSWNPDKEEYPDQEINLKDVEQIFNRVIPRV